MQNVHELINEARNACSHLVGEDSWHDNVETKIYELAENETIAENAIATNNMRLFRAAEMI